MGINNYIELIEKRNGNIILYHSNKEQMNYDYEREQDLQLAGYKIMRFTGSQIFNNPCECVMKVYKYVLDTTIKEKRD